MTTSQSHPDGAPSEAEARWLERLVDDGYGIVITCASAISKSSIAFHNQLSFADDASNREPGRPSRLARAFNAGRSEKYCEYLYELLRKYAPALTAG